MTNLTILPPVVSPYLTLPTRSIQQVMRDTTLAPLWIVLKVSPRHGTYCEQPLEAMRNERSALNHLIDTSYPGDTAIVLNLVEDGTFRDVTEDFARQWATEMKRQDYGVDWIASVRFIRDWLSEAEIEEIG